MTSFLRWEIEKIASANLHENKKNLLYCKVSLFYSTTYANEHYNIWYLFFSYSCYFDAVKGELANLFFTTVPLTLIFVSNIILYFLTWKQIKKEEPRFKDIDGREARIIRASHSAARKMTLFVLAFFIQWWAMCTYGIVQVSSRVEVPIHLFHFVTTFSNIGGVLNGIVYVIIRKKSKEKHSDTSLDLSKLDGKKFPRMLNIAAKKPVTKIEG